MPLEVYGLLNRGENGNLKKYLKYLTSSTLTSSTLQSSTITNTSTFLFLCQVQVLIFSRQVQVLKFKYLTRPNPVNC